MIHLCTCNGGSASSLRLNRKRGVASCKICGGRPLVDGSRSLPESMVSTVGLELTSVINSEWTWKTISKGSRSTSRRARKTISGSPKGIVDWVNKNPIRVEDMPVSESEKLGVTVLGRRFSDKVEHVQPIKKRKFCFQSPSPPSSVPSHPPLESKWLLKQRENASAKESPLNFIANQHNVSIDNAVPDKLASAAGIDLIANQIGSTDVQEKFDSIDDFSGISILAAAACSNSIEGSAGYVEENSMAKDSLLEERKVPLNSDACKELPLVRAEILNHGDLSCASPVHKKEDIVPFEVSKDLGIIPTDVLEAKGTVVALAVGVISASPPSNVDDGMFRRPTPSSRDDRSHWDLNVCMDSWASPSRDSDVNSHDSAEDIKPGEKHDNLEDFEGLKTSGDIENVVEMSTLMVGQVVSANVHNDNTGIVDTLRFVPEVHQGIEDHNLESLTAINEITGLQENVIISDINNALDYANLLKAGAPAHSTQRVFPPSEIIASSSVECVVKPSKMASASVPYQIVPTQHLDLDDGNGEIPSTGQVPCEGSCHDNSCSAVDPSTCEQLVDKCIVDAPRVNDCTEGTQDDETDSKRNSDMLHDGSAVENMLNAADLMSAQALCGASSDDTTGESAQLGASLVSLPTEDLTSSRASTLKDEHQFISAGKLEDVKSMVHDDESPNSAEYDCSMHVDPLQSDGKIDIAQDEHCRKLSRQIPAVVQTQAATVSLLSDETCKSYGDEFVNSSGRVALEDDLYVDSECDSDGSHIGLGNVVETAKTEDVQEDDDLQYEDGELRESITHSWEEAVGDEGEAEHVDYGSDNRDTYGFEATSDYTGCMLKHADDKPYCSKKISVKVQHGGLEGDVVKEKNVDKTNCHPHAGGSLKLNILASGSGKIRAAKFVADLKEKSDLLDDPNEFELVESACKMSHMPDDFCTQGNAAIELSSQSPSSRNKSSGWDQLPKACKSSKDMVLEAKDGTSRKDNTGSHIDGLDSMAIVDKELSSSIEGKTAPEAFLWKSRECMQRSRSSNLDDSTFRVDRDTSSSKSFRRGGSSLHLHGRGRGGDHHVDSSGRHWGTNCHHSPSYYGPGFAHTGPRSAAAAAAKLESNGLVVAPDGTIVKAGSIGTGVRVRRQQPNDSSHCVHRSLTRKGSPVERENKFSTHMGPAAVGDGSPERSNVIGRGRSRRYGPRLIGNNSRERYHESVPDDSISSSYHILHPLARRKQSISPIQRGGAPHHSRSRTRSRSRSKTRSPHLWQAPRGKIGYGPGLRQFSRSPPNFKSEVRVHRIRSPHHRPGFVLDHMGSFDSTLAGRAYPPHTSRWIEDRKDGAEYYYRENSYKQRSLVSRRSSPGRPLRRSHKFDSVDPSSRFRADEYHRQIQPGRFSEMAGGGGRGPRYDGSGDDKRKHGDRYGVANSVRHHDTDETVRRLRYGLEDDASVNNSRNKDYARPIDNRLVDATRRGREDKGHFRYGRDEKHNATSKSFEMRDCIEDTAPRRRRPS